MQFPGLAQYCAIREQEFGTAAGVPRLPLGGSAGEPQPDSPRRDLDERNGVLPAGGLTGTGPAIWTPLARKEGAEVTWLPTQRPIQLRELVVRKGVD